MAQAPLLSVQTIDRKVYPEQLITPRLSTNWISILTETTGPSSLSRLVYSSSWSFPAPPAWWNKIKSNTEFKSIYLLWHHDSFQTSPLKSICCVVKAFWMERGTQRWATGRSSNWKTNPKRQEPLQSKEFRNKEFGKLYHQRWHILFDIANLYRTIHQCIDLHKRPISTRISVRIWIFRDIMAIFIFLIRKGEIANWPTLESFERELPYFSLYYIHIILAVMRFSSLTELLLLGCLSTVYIGTWIH